jgi:hypothetical protein
LPTKKINNPELLMELILILQCIAVGLAVWAAYTLGVSVGVEKGRIAMAEKFEAAGAAAMRE